MTEFEELPEEAGRERRHRIDPQDRRAWLADNLVGDAEQALVLTAIVIGFATTALFLVVLLAARGWTGTDHVDGTEGLS